MCSEFGILGLPFPAGYGGLGEDIFTATLMYMEGLGYGCRDDGLTFSINAQSRCGADGCQSSGSARTSKNSGTRQGSFVATPEYEIELGLRDSTAGKVYSGTSEIQRNTIGRGLSL